VLVLKRDWRDGNRNMEMEGKEEKDKTRKECKGSRTRRGQNCFGKIATGGQGLWHCVQDLGFEEDESLTKEATRGPQEHSWEGAARMVGARLPRRHAEKGNWPGSWYDRKSTKVRMGITWAFEKRRECNFWTQGQNCYRGPGETTIICSQFLKKLVGTRSWPRARFRRLGKRERRP